MKKWEYLVTNISNEQVNYGLYDTWFGFKGNDLQDILTSYGKYGWELVGFEGTKYVFKKEVIKV